MKEMTETCCKFAKLNADYLEIMNTSGVKEIVFQSKRNNFRYKLKKLGEISRYLGITSMFSFMLSKNKSKSMFRTEPLDFQPKHRKVAVYTSIFGNIDSIIEPFCKTENVDYFIITDQVVPEKSLWKPIPVMESDMCSSLTDQYKNRYCKLFPNKFLQNYDYSIYVDGNILIVSDLSLLIDRLYGKSMGIFLHPGSNDVYEEAAAVLYLGNAKGREVREQMNYYKKEGFPKNYGLFENSLIVRRHKDPSCIELMEQWWNQLVRFTCRDQLSFMYVLWSSSYGREFVSALGENIDLCPLIRRMNHLNK